MPLPTNDLISHSCNHTLDVNSAGPPAPTTTVAIADTSCTTHFFTVNMLVCNKQISHHPISIQNPNGTIMHSTHNAKLDIPGLPQAAQIGHVMPALSNAPLLSIRQFCDARCQVAFMATTIDISYHKPTHPAGNLHATHLVVGIGHPATSAPTHATMPSCHRTGYSS